MLGYGGAYRFEMHFSVNLFWAKWPESSFSIRGGDDRRSPSAPRGGRRVPMPPPPKYAPVGDYWPRIEVDMKINLLSTVFQQNIVSLMHNMLVLNLTIFFRYIVTGPKRLLGSGGGRYFGMGRGQT